MKRYGQRCPVARTLDVIGERWTPLIVRELLVGPKRYTDLLDALPGVGTNILADRLAALQEHGVVRRRRLPPPTPVDLYELTEVGEALAPVIRELRSWGRRFAPPPQGSDAVRPAWVLQSAASTGAALAAGQTCELQVGDEVFELAAAGEEIEVKARPPVSSPDAAIRMSPAVLTRLATGRITPSRAKDSIEVEGDRRVADDVLRMLAGSAH